MRVANDMLLRSQRLRGAVGLRSVHTMSHGLWMAVSAVAVLGCGSEYVPSDASVDASDEVISDANPFDDIPPIDATPPFDAGFIVVDGGSDCAIPAKTICNSHAAYSCCNGQLCRGFCAVFPDSGAPVCFCAGVTGGCPGSTVCCGYAQWPLTCVGNDGQCTIGPPCP